jgi:DNA polymerase-3 subunit gamma/tau
MILSRLGLLEEKLKSGDFQVKQSTTVETQSKLKNNPEKSTSTSNPIEREAQELIHSAVIDESIDGAVSITSDELKANWQEIIGYLNGNKNKVVSMLIGQGKIKGINGHVITIEFEEMYSINKKILDQPEKRKIAEEAFAKTLNKSVRLNYTIVSNKSSIDDSFEKIRRELGEDVIEIIE